MQQPMNYGIAKSNPIIIYPLVIVSWKSLTVCRRIRTAEERGEDQCTVLRDGRVQNEKTNRKNQREWPKKGGCESVMFIRTTAAFTTTNMYQDEIDRIELKVRVVEQAARWMKSILQRFNSFKDSKCITCRRSKPLTLILLLDPGRSNEILIRA